MISILGAGALGRAYAFELARSGAAVTLVTRTAPAEAESAWLAGERRSWPCRTGRQQVAVAQRIPGDTGLVLVCVRAEQLEAVLPELISAGTRAVTVVILTPLLSPRAEQIAEAVPGCVLAMPTLIAELLPDRVAYWVTPSATLLSREPRPTPALNAFITRLRSVHVPVRRQAKLARYATATTLRLFPIQLAFLRQSNLEQWSTTLLDAVCAALRQSRQLAKRVHPGEPAVRMLAWLLSCRFLLGLFAYLLPRVAPRLSKVLGMHFGEKLRAQHQLLYVHFQQLAAQHAVSLRFDACLEP